LFHERSVVHVCNEVVRGLDEFSFTRRLGDFMIFEFLFEVLIKLKALGACLREDEVYN
jgi:hypothetical protein